MLKGETIVCISNTTWYGEYTKSTVQLMSLLAKDNNVLFVEYPFTWKDIVNTWRKKQKAPIMRMLGLKPTCEQISTNGNENVYHLVSPPVLPVDFIKIDSLFKILFGFNTFLYRKRLKRKLKNLGLKDPIVVTAYNPFYGLSMVGKLDEKLNVYYCYDGMGTRRHGKRIFPMDRKFSTVVDGIVVTSDYLKEDKKEFNSNSFVAKNGVDFSLFNQFAKQVVSNDKERKVVGYIGSMDHRFDIDTVEYAVRNLKDFDFEFTGNLRNQEIKERLEKYQNVKFFPAVQPDEVPALLAKSDVGIIPYLMNDINKNIYPLKINEYLSVGVPVVMNAFAHLPEFEAQVSVAKNKEDFVKCLLSEINNDSDERIQNRIQMASQNSWEAKAVEFADVVETLMNKKL